MESLKPNPPLAAASVIAAAMLPPSSPPIARIVPAKSVIPDITLPLNSLSNRNKLEVSTGVCCIKLSVNATMLSTLSPSTLAYFCCVLIVLVICAFILA